MTQMREARLREQELILCIPVPMAPTLRSVNRILATAAVAKRL
ncbi:hypothetical protein [Paenibacillus sanguinis]|nr:hypothetical protein [Paenibacillus sanguinis]